MSVDMKSQDSDESDYMEDDDDYGGYYDNDTDDLDIDKPKKTDDPEYFEYELLQVEDVERLLNEEVEMLCRSIKVRNLELLPLNLMLQCCIAVCYILCMYLSYHSNQLSFCKKLQKIKCCKFQSVQQTLLPLVFYSHNFLDRLDE